MEEITLKKVEVLIDMHLTAFLGEERNSMKPIDIDLFLREYLNNTVCYRKLSQNGDVLGVSVFSDMTLRIWKNNERVKERFAGGTVIIEEALLEQKHLGRRNYTKAHEAVHSIVNLSTPLGDSVCYRRGVAASDYEKMIDKAAAKLLLPDGLVSRVFYAFMGAEHIQRINPICNNENYKKFCHMAHYLCVSKKALSLRLLQLGLVDVADYEKPHEFLNIWYGGESDEIFTRKEA